MSGAFDNLHRELLSLHAAIKAEWSWRHFFAIYAVVVVIAFTLHYLGVL
jgi:hypothetical protein